LGFSTYISKIFRTFRNFEIWIMLFVPQKYAKKNAKNRTKKKPRIKQIEREEWNKKIVKSEKK
jgi:hypothetical protein